MGHTDNTMTRHAEWRKWMVLVATIWIQAFTGTNFNFPSYSSELKSALEITQVELNYLSMASDFGKLFGWCSGVLLLCFPTWVVVFMAAFLGLFGYGLQWLLVQRLVSLPYFMLVAVSLGSTLPATNNLGQICQSHGYGLETEELVTIYSTCSFFGRLISAVPDLSSFFYTPQMNTKRYTTRTGWLALSLMPMPLAFLMLVLSDTKAILRAATGLIGISSGFIFSAAVSITSELFGSKSSGINHNILITNIPLGSLLYGVLGGVIYDNNIKSSNETVFEEVSRNENGLSRILSSKKKLDLGRDCL
ncbi:nuclear fusion defective 4-like protein [Tanacetum coccineum]